MIVSSPAGKPAIMSSSRARRAASRMSRLGRFEPSVGDVLADRAGEEEDILLHDADLAPQRRERHVADIDAVDRDAARIDLVEAGQQRADRRLARAGWTDEGDRLARRGWSD